MQINEFLGYCKNLYKRLKDIYKDIPFVSVVVGNSQNSFYVAHNKYRTSYKVFGEPRYFDCHKDSMLVKTLDMPFFYDKGDGNVGRQNYGYYVVPVSGWVSINSEDEVIADVALWLQKLDKIEKKYLIEHICKEEKDDDELYSGWNEICSRKDADC